MRAGDSLGDGAERTVYLPVKGKALLEDFDLQRAPLLGRVRIVPGRKQSSTGILNVGAGDRVWLDGVCSARGADRRESAAATSSAARWRARSDRSPSARACRRQAIRLTSQTLLCDGVGSPKRAANLARNSDTRNRGKAAISVATVEGMDDSPRVEKSW
jgi:hypothetical protein